MFRETNPFPPALRQAVRYRAVASLTNAREPEVCPGFLASCSETPSPPGAVPRQGRDQTKDSSSVAHQATLCRGSNPQVSMAHCLSAEAEQKFPYGVRLAHLDGIELAPFGEPELCSIVFDDFFLRLDHLLADRRVNDH